MDRMVGVNTHRAKLEHHERLHHLPDALLSEEHRTWRLELHQGRNHEEKRPKNREQRQADRDVERSLDDVITGLPLLARARLTHDRINRPKTFLLRRFRVWMHV